MDRLSLNRVQYPVTVLGHGVRAGIWVQGCTLACPGCMSRDTWEDRPDTAVDIGDLLTWVQGLPDPLHGVTISGGEPFQQPPALAELLRGLRGVTAQRAEPVDLLLYSGYAWSRLARSAACRTALGLCDTVVAGPYVVRRNTGAPLRGSDNQRVVVLTPLGHERYGPEALDRWPSRRLQAGVDEDGIRLVGIPREGDLRRWEDALRRSGVHWTGASWNG
jgi:anaerobic ribonucleoside-triphosphate reductase activating protein